MTTDKELENLIKRLNETGCTTSPPIMEAIVKAWGRGLSKVLSQTREVPQRKAKALYKADMRGWLSSYQLAQGLEMLKRHSDATDYYILISSGQDCLTLKTQTAQVTLATKQSGCSAWLVKAEELLNRIKFYKKQKGFITVEVNVDTGNLDFLLDQKVVQNLTPIDPALPLCGDYSLKFAGRELAVINNQSALLIAQEFSRMKAKGNAAAAAYKDIVFDKKEAKDPQYPGWLNVVTTDTVRMIKSKPKAPVISETFTLDRVNFLKLLPSWKALKLHKVEGNITLEELAMSNTKTVAVHAKAFGIELTVLVPKGDEHFMDCEKIFPKEYLRSIKVDSRVFKEALDECLSLSKPRTDKRVMLNFKAGSTEMEMQTIETVDIDVPWLDDGGNEVMVTNSQGETVVRTCFDKQHNVLHSLTVPLHKDTEIYSDCHLLLDGSFLLDCIAVQAAPLNRMTLAFTDCRIPILITIDDQQKLPEVTWLLMPINMKVD